MCCNVSKCLRQKESFIYYTNYIVVQSTLLQLDYLFNKRLECEGRKH